MPSLKIRPGASSEELLSFSQRASQASDFLKAISHESRLMILCILAEGEKTVSQMEGMLGLQQAVVSQQLARLRQENVVTTRRDGRQVYYSIANPDVASIIDALYSVFCKR